MKHIINLFRSETKYPQKQKQEKPFVPFVMLQTGYIQDSYSLMAKYFPERDENCVMVYTHIKESYKAKEIEMAKKDVLKKLEILYGVKNPRLEFCPSNC